MCVSLSWKVNKVEPVAENGDNHEKTESLHKEIEHVSEQISKFCSDKNKKILKDFIGDYDTGMESFNQIKTWALKKRLAPRNIIDPPAAKKDALGNLVTKKNELGNLYLET